MNKIYILLLFFSIIGSNYSFADCVTGYACSIEGLQAINIQLEEIFLKELNDYFSMDINDDFMLGRIDKDFKYKDLFPFTVYLET